MKNRHLNFTLAELLLKLIAGKKVSLETLLPAQLVAGNTLQAVK